MARKIDTIADKNDKLFKTYNKFSSDHFSNKPRGMKFELNTYHNYLADALSFIKAIATEDFIEANNKKVMKQVMQDNHGLVLRSLKASAYTKPTASWDKLRRALQVAYKAAGLSEISDIIAQTKNPAPVSERSHNTNKSKRIGKITDEMYQEFKDALVEDGDSETLWTVELIRRTGMRPAELIECRLVENNTEEGTVTLFIEGAKKTLKGKELPVYKRGIDRTLTVKSTDLLQGALKMLGKYDHLKVQSVQNKIGRLSRKLRPDSDKHLCLYSFRYTYGSNLKRNLYTMEGGRMISAAIMGHKNTTSISAYGHFKSGTLGVEMPKVDQDAINQVKDDVGQRFGREGKNFDIGQAIRNREYRKDNRPDLDSGLSF
jgi:integrase